SVDGGVLSLAFSPDGKTLASGGDNKAVVLWAIPTGKERRRIAVPESEIDVIAFSPDGRVLATGGKQVRLWDAAVGRQLGTLDNGGSVASISFSADGALLCATGWPSIVAPGTVHGKVTVWEVASRKVLRRYEGAALRGIFAALSPDGKLLASSGWDR